MVNLNNGGILLGIIEVYFCVCVCVCVHVCGATSSQGSAAAPSTEGKQDGNAEISVCKIRSPTLSFIC